MRGEATFTLSGQDHLEANRDLLLTQIVRRRTAVRLACVVLFLAGLGAFLAWLDPYPGESPLAVAGDVALLGLGMVLFIYAALLATLKPRMRRAYRQQKTLQRPFAYRWSEAGLDVEAPHLKAHYDWTDFHRWLVARRAILFFFSDQHCLILPRRVLDEEDVESLRSHLSASRVPAI